MSHTVIPTTSTETSLPALSIETRVFQNHRDEWKGRSIVNALGYDWRIDTYKGSGGTITSTATGGHNNEKGSWEWMMFTDPNITLVKIKARATEKAMREVHAQAVAVFTERYNAGDLLKK